MKGVGDFWEQLRGWIGENHKTIAITVGGLVVSVQIVSLLKEKAIEYRTQAAMKKWENAPKDVVILHSLPRGKTVPNLSPFVMKLETYLRMAKIPYEFDTDVPWSPLGTGKTPWISLNGEHFTDSQLIIKMLNAKYNVKIGDHTVEQRAYAKAVRVMMDEYLYWGVAMWRWWYSGGKGLDKIFDMPPFALKVFYKMVTQRVQAAAWSQGLGRLPKEQVTELMMETLQTASQILGDKPFLLGREPCEEDSSLFGFLCMVVWAAPGSPYEKFVIDELPNLQAYCNRMKDRFWGDWDKCLAVTDSDEL